MNALNDPSLISCKSLEKSHLSFETTINSAIHGSPQLLSSPTPLTTLLSASVCSSNATAPPNDVLVPIPLNS